MSLNHGERPTGFNYPLALFVSALILICVSVVMVYASSAAMPGLRVREPSTVEGAVDRMQLSTSSSAAYLKKQLVWSALGIGVMAFFYLLKYDKLKSLSLWMLLAAAAGLVLVLFTAPRNGARRWLGVGGLGVQPSELAKIAMTLFMARFLYDRSDRIRSFWRCVVPATLILAAALGLIFVEPDYGATAVLAAIVGSMWFIAGVRLWHMGILAAPAIAGFVAMVVQSPVRWRRVVAFLDLENNLDGPGYHVYQSLIALGSGGPGGVGLGGSMQKFQFLAEAHTDFIVSIIGEELGLAGMTALLLVFGALVFFGFRVAYQTPDFYGALVAYGMTAMIAFPLLVNIGVATSCLPAKGLALPFISYGGSSMLVNCAAVGILMNIASANYIQAGIEESRRE